MMIRRWGSASPKSLVSMINVREIVNVPLENRLIYCVMLINVLPEAVSMVLISESESKPFLNA